MYEVETTYEKALSAAQPLQSSLQQPENRLAPRSKLISIGSCTGQSLSDPDRAPVGYGNELLCFSGTIVTPSRLTRLRLHSHHTFSGMYMLLTALLATSPRVRRSVRRRENAAAAAVCATAAAVCALWQ